MSVMRAEQIGSLIRPDRLQDARDEYHAGRIDLDALRSVEDECILEALEMQRNAGMDVFTDGEMRRDAWQTNIMQSVDGFEPDYPVREMELPDGSRVKLELHTKAVVSRLKQHRRLTEVDASFLTKSGATPFKITMPAPSTIARGGWKAGVTDKVYGSLSELYEDVATIIRDEMKALVAEGVTYIQLDEAFTVFARQASIQQMLDRGEDPEALLAQAIEFENFCYDVVKSEGVTLAAHLCRGSRSSALKPSLTDPDRQGEDFDWLAERVFPQLHVDRFLFEWDSGFQALKYLPRDKMMVLGIVTSLYPDMEDAARVARCVENAAKYCSADQLALSSQCGFSGSGTRDGAHMTIDEEKRKLEFIANTAHRIWR